METQFYFLQVTIWFKSNEMKNFDVIICSSARRAAKRFSKRDSASSSWRKENEVGKECVKMKSQNVSKFYAWILWYVFFVKGKSTKLRLDGKVFFFSNHQIHKFAPNFVSIWDSQEVDEVLFFSNKSKLNRSIVSIEHKHSTLTSIFAHDHFEIIWESLPAG